MESKSMPKSQKRDKTSGGVHEDVIRFLSYMFISSTFQTARRDIQYNP